MTCQLSQQELEVKPETVSRYPLSQNALCPQISDLIKTWPLFTQISSQVPSTVGSQSLRAKLQGHLACSKPGSHCSTISRPMQLSEASSDPCQTFESFEIHPPLVLTAHCSRQKKPTAFQMKMKKRSPPILHLLNLLCLHSSLFFM